MTVCLRQNLRFANPGGLITMHGAESRVAAATRSTQTVAEAFAMCESQQSGRKLLLTTERGTLSYRALFDRVARLGTFFAEAGLEPGDRAVIASDQDLAVASLFLALLRHGITAVLINPAARPAELEVQIEAADAKILFLDEAVIKRCGESIAQLPLVAVTEDKGESSFIDRLRSRRRSDRMGSRPSFPQLLRAANPEKEPAPDVPLDTVAYILFTSGTTSKPKGVEITHGNMFAQMNTFVRQYGFDKATRLVNLLPFHHTDGLTHGLMVSFWAGASLLRPLRVRVELVERMLDEVYRHRATHLITVPSVLALMLNVDEQYDDSLRGDDFEFLISTAAYLDEGLWRSIEDRFGVRVVNVYGLTETVCESLYCGPDDETRKLGTIGKPVDAEAKIVDDAGRIVANGETGELLLRGEHIMKGYFRMPEATAAVLEDGWFHTGDLATRDEEGFFSIVGRKKDVIISAGFNVYPEDVNAALRSIGGVVDAATFGVEAQPWGEKVVSCIIAADDSGLTEEAVARAFLERASREKLPREIHLFPEFPRGPAGKVIVDQLRDLVSQKAAARVASGPGQGDVESRLFSLVASVLKCPIDEIALESRPDNTPSWNSLAHVELLLAAEREFSLKFSPRDMMLVGSIGDLLDLVVKGASAR